MIATVSWHCHSEIHEYSREIRPNIGTFWSTVRNVLFRSTLVFDMATARPSVLLLLTDQERYDVSAPDGPEVKTPAIDGLGRDGMRFDRAYTPISICTSARGSLLSGLYPHTHGMINNCHERDAVLENFPTDIPTFGERLANAGYRTSYVGKWHLGIDQRPPDFGFDYLGGGDRKHDDMGEDFRAYQRSLGVDPDVVELDETIWTEDADPVLIAAKSPVPVEATRAYYIADRTIDALESAATADNPFFHRSDFLGPHHPYVVPEPYASMYDPEAIDPWETFAETDAGKPAVHGKYRQYRGVEHFDWERWSEAVAKYFGFVSLIDDQISRILDAVEQLDLEDMAVVHTADHGDFTGSHRQFNKGPLMYEETYHIPLFVRWPDVVEPESTCDEFVRLLDLMPTFLDMADEPIPDGIHGRSIVPLLRGEVPSDWLETVFAEYHGDEYGFYSQRMVRSKRYKYVYNVPDTDELYDLDHDPNELHNLIDHPEYRGVRGRLRQRLLDWMEQTDDTILAATRRSIGTPA